MKPLIFRVLKPYRYKGECPDFVPWSYIEGHKEQAMKNHQQTLERLNERGGLDPVEIYAVMNNMTWPEVSHITLEFAIKWIMDDGDSRLALAANGGSDGKP